MQSYLYNIFVKYLLPKLRWPKGIHLVHSSLIKRVIEPGDILLSATTKSLGAQLIPGKWDHAAIYTGKNKDEAVSEMVANGYQEVSLDYFLKDCDHVCLLRARDWTFPYTRLFIDTCLGFKGVQYDRQFTLGIKALYCSELIYHSDIDKKLVFNLEDLAGLGRPYLSPIGIYNSKSLRKLYEC